MPTLSWQEADYARGDSSSRQALINEYDRQLKELGALATGNGYHQGPNYYKDVIDKVRRHWKGADAEAFISNYEKTAKLLQQKTEELRKYLSRAIDNDSKQFASFQSTMATKMNVF